MQVNTLTTLRIGQPGAYESVPPNTLIELSEQEAQVLIKRGLVMAHLDNMPEANNLLEAIVDAIDDLPPESFGKEGKPSVKSIESVISQNISAADRDKAWQMYQDLVSDGQ